MVMIKFVINTLPFLIALIIIIIENTARRSEFSVGIISNIRLRWRHLLCTLVFLQFISHNNKQLKIIFCTWVRSTTIVSEPSLSFQSYEELGSSSKILISICLSLLTFKYFAKSSYERMRKTLTDLKKIANTCQRQQDLWCQSSFTAIGLHHDTPINLFIMIEKTKFFPDDV